MLISCKNSNYLQFAIIPSHSNPEIHKRSKVQLFQGEKILPGLIVYACGHLQTEIQDGGPANQDG